MAVSDIVISCHQAFCRIEVILLQQHLIKRRIRFFTPASDESRIPSKYFVRPSREISGAVKSACALDSRKTFFPASLNAAAFPARRGTVSVLLSKSHGTFSPDLQFLFPLPKQLDPQTAAGTHPQCRFPVHGCRGIPF